MKFAEILHSECSAIGLELGSKNEVLFEVAALAKECILLREISQQDILSALVARESIGSTALGGGFAIPHCRLPNLVDFVVGLISIPAGVDFGAVDGSPVTLVAFVVAPKYAADENIRVLSRIAQVLSDKKTVDELNRRESPSAMLECFLNEVPGEPDGVATEKTNMCLVHVFVQHEILLPDVLAALTSGETKSIAVLESENARNYLTRMPLFAGFWSDGSETYSRLVVAVLGEHLALESARRIESLIDNLDDGSGIMIAVQKLSFFAGQIRTLEGRT